MVGASSLSTGPPDVGVGAEDALTGAWGISFPTKKKCSLPLSVTSVSLRLKEITFLSPLLQKPGLRAIILLAHMVT